jgi:hypothetical protein
MAFPLNPSITKGGIQMKEENLNEKKIDKFLKKALKDDLPPEVERKMKRQLTEFRERIETKRAHRETETASFLWRLLSGQRVEWGQYMLKRGVVALASIIVVVLGIHMQTTGAQGGLAESLTALGTSASVFSQVRGVESMECLINIHDKNKETLQYSIQWLPPNKTRARLEKPGEIPFQTMWIKDQEIAIVDHANGTIRNIENMEKIKDSPFQPILDFLSPSLVEEKLQGQWILKQFKQQEDHEWGIFDVINLEERTRMEVTINMSTHLPVTLKKIVLDPSRARGEGAIFINVSFKWNTPIPLDLMVPKIKEGS